MDKVIAKLKADKIGVFASVSAEGVPQTATVHFAYDEENQIIVIGTENTSRKYQNILKNSAAAFLVGFDPAAMETIQMDGTAYASEAEELTRLTDLYYAKFPNARIYKDDPKTVYIAFKPTWICYSNFKASPPDIQVITPEN